MQPLFEDLVRQWSQVARFGTGLARSLARAALFAAMRARHAVLHGQTEDVDAFIADWLDQKPTSWRREAVAAVLLDDGWIPTDPDDADGFGLIDDLRNRTEAEARNHKWIADTQLRGSRVVMLDGPLPLAEGEVVTLGDVLPDPKTRHGLPIDIGFNDERLNVLLGRLRPDEQAVVRAYGDGRNETWESAAVAAGLSPDFGERVRRKCKRERDLIARRAAAAANSRPAQTGLTNYERR